MDQVNGQTTIAGKLDREKRENAQLRRELLTLKFQLRLSGYGIFDGRIFPIGTKLTSKENGELIEAPKGTPDELIVGTVI